jgi:hypothetical protein
VVLGRFSFLTMRDEADLRVIDQVVARIRLMGNGESDE